MRKILLPALAGLIIGLTVPSPILAQDTFEERDDVEAVAQDDPEMNKAIATAKQTLPDFLAMLENPPKGAHSIGFKFPLGGWEHIWVYDVRRDGDYLTGRLSNIPVQEQWSQHEMVRVPLSEVSDWAWMNNDGVMQGHFTTRVLLDRVEPEYAAAVRADFGW